MLRRRSWPPSVPFKAKSLSRQKLGWQNGSTGKGACHQSVNPSQSPITYMMKEKMAPHKLFSGFYTWVGAGMDGHVCACTHMHTSAHTCAYTHKQTNKMYFKNHTILPTRIKSGLERWLRD